MLCSNVRDCFVDQLWAMPPACTMTSMSVCYYACCLLFTLVSIALTDLDADGKLDVVVPSDVHYVCAYDGSGVPIKVATGVCLVVSLCCFGDLCISLFCVVQVWQTGTVWGQIGYYQNFADEQQGYGYVRLL